jgi:hypothetical protein
MSNPHDAGEGLSGATKDSVRVGSYSPNGMADDLTDLVADRPGLEEVSYHSNGQADADAGGAHDYASCRDPRSDAPDHHEIPDGRQHVSGGVLVPAQ